MNSKYLIIGINSTVVILTIVLIIILAKGILTTVNLSSQLASVSDFDSDLVAHYTFDDTADDSAGSNDGTVYGNPTYVEGKIGKAISFDGVDDYVIKTNPS